MQGITRPHEPFATCSDTNCWAPQLAWMGVRLVSWLQRVRLSSSVPAPRRYRSRLRTSLQLRPQARNGAGKGGTCSQAILRRLRAGARLCPRHRICPIALRLFKSPCLHSGNGPVGKEEDAEEGQTYAKNQPQRRTRRRPAPPPRRAQRALPQQHQEEPLPAFGQGGAPKMHRGCCWRRP